MSVKVRKLGRVHEHAKTFRRRNARPWKYQRQNNKTKGRRTERMR